LILSAFSRAPVIEPTNASCSFRSSGLRNTSRNDRPDSAKRVFNRVDFNGGLIKLLPAISALVVLGLGLAMTVRALPHVT